jgi:hypothetical protein
MARQGPKLVVCAKTNDSEDAEVRQEVVYGVGLMFARWKRCGGIWSNVPWRC